MLPMAQLGQDVAVSLASAGVLPFDESVYRAVITRHAADVSELALDLGASPSAVAAALSRLYDHGLVGRMAGDGSRYAATEPQTAVDSLIRARSLELERARSAAVELASLFAAAQASVADQVELISGREALGRWFVRLQQQARDEVMTLDRPPYALATSNPVEETAMGNGVRYRAIYAPEALEWPGVLDDIQGLIGHGEQARVLPGIRVKIAIADRRLALMPLSLDFTDVVAAVIRPSTLLDALVDYWDLCWRAAVPLEAPPDDPLAPEDRDLLRLLVAGLKDEAIARQLGWSIRTMRRRISRLHDLLGAANRFQAGVIAARRGLL